MRIAIIDADLIGRKNHRFPNLACMKLSAYYKSAGNHVILERNYDNLCNYDKILISKVFTDTVVPKEVLEMNNVEYGGTGFYYDKAPKLPDEIEHSYPDYDLYDNFVKEQIEKGVKTKDLKEYTDISIGFTTRGCIRQCEFCVNQNYTKANVHSSIEEFFDPTRKYICLLDDNIFACKDWKRIFDELIATNHKFYFKQGMDERLLTDEKCDYLFNKANWYGDYVFAFDNIKDRGIIEKKLQMIRKHTDKICKFYVLCGYDSQDEIDIANTFERIKILMRYHCLPYIMRHENYQTSKYKGIYITLARWCNQPSFFKKKSFREYCEANQAYKKDQTTLCSSMKAMVEFEKDHPDIAAKYYDLRFS